MGKLAFLFPGQGAQVVGMGKDFYDAYDLAKERFAEADEALGYSISKLCFEGPADQLQLTENTQPAILTVSVIAAQLLQERGVSPAIAGGHSLGEYAALVLAGALSFRDAVVLVHKRGAYMQEAVPVGEGAMAAGSGVGGRRGRGKKLSPSPVKAWALSHDIPVLQPARARDAAFAEALRALRPDVAGGGAFADICRVYIAMRNRRSATEIRCICFVMTLSYPMMYLMA